MVDLFGFTITQAVFAMLGLFMIFMTYVLYRKRRIDLKGTVLWLILWGGLFVSIFLFNYIAYFAQNILDVQPEDLFVFVSVFILFCVMFGLYGKLQRSAKKIEDITEELAKKDARK